MNALEIKNVSHCFGNKKVLNNINLNIEEGQFVSLIGNSGCGKSTLLRAILGTHPSTSGTIHTDGIKVVRPSRNVGIVYQNYQLYDYLTSEENVAIGLTWDQTTLPQRLIKFWWWLTAKSKFMDCARAMLDKVGLLDVALSYPVRLSGGMRQRVAIAQALIMKPKLLLLDEPFGALDEATREELQNLLISLYKENQEAKKEGKKPPYTVLIVTHELNEAIYLSDRVIGLSQYHSDGKNGASIVYDKKATAFDRNSTRDYSLFIDQKQELREIVFNDNYQGLSTDHCVYGG